MYLHCKKYEIRYTDADFDDNLKLSSLLSVMEESACLSADELGFGYSFLQPQNLGFVLVNWYVDLYRPIKLGEVLTVHTWPIRPGRLVVFRDFELYVGEEKVGVATSRWCLVNLADFSFVRASSVFRDDIEYNDFRSVDINNIKVPECVGGEKIYSRLISYSDYDHYNHANNTKYADYILDVFSIDEMKGKALAGVRINYAKQSKYGETLDFYRCVQEDGSWIVEGRCGGELRVCAQVIFNG